MYEAKYLKQKPLLEVKVAGSASWGWKSILAGRAVLRRRVGWRIGVGSEIDIWQDPCLPRPYITFRPIRCLDDEWRRVGDLIDNSALSSRRLEGRAVWHPSNSGVYSVRSGYQSACELATVAESSSGTMDQHMWKEIWGFPCSQRVKKFFLESFLAVNANLNRRGMREDGICTSCHKGAETVNHVLMECEPARAFWYGSHLQALDSSKYRNLAFDVSWSRIKDWLTRANRYKEGMSFFAYGLWRIWKGRNIRVFENKQLDIQQCIRLAVKDMQEYQGVKEQNESCRSDSLRLVNIVNGKKACPLDLVPIWERIREMHGMFVHCDVSFVKRELNGRTHCLAKSVYSIILLSNKMFVCGKK